MSVLSPRRPVGIDMHAKGVDQGMIDAEHLGTYHQADIRAEQLTEQPSFIVRKG